MFPRARACQAVEGRALSVRALLCAELQGANEVPQLHQLRLQLIA